MAVIHMKVLYVDDEEKVVRITPRAQTEAEAKFHGMTDDSAVQVMHWTTWRSLYQSGQEGSDYETWLDKIADIEPVDEKADSNAVDPTTGATPSPNGSSQSVSEPVSASTT